ncbi:hypothetical protein NHJ13734_007157 [Beauveria thailandica]
MDVAQGLSLSTTCKSGDCVDTPSPCKALKPTETFSWTEADTYYTKLFRAWDNLPVHDASTETELLLELDHIISLFDSYIGHNDLGFRAWVSRHQRAMDLGLVETPTWPKLYRLKGGKQTWRDEVWVSRYSFLVNQRDIVAKSRLQRMTCCELADKKCFFGLSWAYPRQTVRTVQSMQPARLRDRWYEPLDNCLARMAAESCGRLDFWVLHAEFWGTGAPADTAVTARDCKIKCDRLEDVDVKHVGCIRNGV